MPDIENAIVWAKQPEVPALDPKWLTDSWILYVDASAVGFEQAPGAKQEADKQGEAQQTAQAELE